MKLLPLTLRFSALLACLGLPFVAHARSGIIPSPRGSQTEFHVEVGFTYASGMNNVINQLEKNFGLEDDASFPVGLKISGYAKMANGFAIGGGIGPMQYFEVRTYRPHYGSYYYYDYYYDDYYYDSSYHYDVDDIESSYIIPVFADIRYYFPKNSLMTPYVRAGISYPISGGDHLSAGTPGAIGAIGAQFIESRYFSLGVELGFDDSRVQVKSGPFHQKEKVRPTEFTISISAIF
jgi:hypothetical protein